jgi:hypothetical protein
MGKNKEDNVGNINRIISQTFVLRPEHDKI